MAQKVADLPAKEKILHRIVREAIELRAKDPSKAHLCAMIQETTCDWCGRDLHIVDDHKIVDRQSMCNPCVDDAFGLQRATPPQQELGMEPWSDEIPPNWDAFC